MSAPKELVYYTIWIQCPTVHIPLEGMIGRIKGGAWHLISSRDQQYGVYRDAARIPTLQGVKDAMASKECRRWLEWGAKYVISKHTTEIVESTLESPLSQLARTAE